MTAFNEQRALELLRIGAGDPEAEFRPGQKEAIAQTIRPGARMLVVQRTGWGKSFVYFIAAKLLRESGHGPTLLVSPLLALMRNQIEAAGRMGVVAAQITGENEEEWDQIQGQLAAGEIDVLLISPERLKNEQFIREFLPHVAQTAALLVVDEAHCISDWGHDFRPDYRRIDRLVRNLPASLRLLATTATANQRVMDDLTSMLDGGLEVVRGPLVREGLCLQTLRVSGEAERMVHLESAVSQIQGSGIVYCATKRDAYRIAAWLQACGHTAEAYTGDHGDARPELEQRLLRNEIKALVATVALGMGFDKPDLKFVIHYQAPGSVIAYYQQVGRAGRSNDGAHGILFSGPHDIEIQEYFIRAAFPRAQDVDRLLEGISEWSERHSSDGSSKTKRCSNPELLKYVNLKEKELKKILNLLTLEDDPPITYDRDCGWSLTARKYDGGLTRRAARITTLRNAELIEMQRYIDLKDGHMPFILAALDSDEPPVQTTVPPAIVTGVSPDRLAQAQEFLAPEALEIIPIGQWPPGGIPQFGETGNIPKEKRNQPGITLCRWGDPTIGSAVEAGKYENDHFSDDLVSRAVDSIRDWNPEVMWVCPVPSARRPQLVPSLARRIAEGLDLPCVSALVATGTRPPQKTMRNRHHQAHNVDGIFAMDLELTVPSGPVLLVDDIVDSRWTMTVAGRMLIDAGAERVHPFALAATWGDSS